MTNADHAAFSVKKYRQTIQCNRIEIDLAESSERDVSVNMGLLLLISYVLGSVKSLFILLAYLVLHGHM